MKIGLDKRDQELVWNLYLSYFASSPHLAHFPLKFGVLPESG